MTVKEFKHDYFSFKGRLNRKPFLMRLMMLGAISIFFVLIVINAEPHLKEDPAHFATNVRKSLVFWVYYIPLIIASISLAFLVFYVARSGFLLIFVPSLLKKFPYRT